MAFKIVYTKSFNKDLRGLQRTNKKVAQAVLAAMTDAGINGEIASLSRTRHGETRIGDVEKYDLSDGYRLVLQLLDGVSKTRAFLFAGSHDDTERWLDNHRNYKWVKNGTDGTLDFVQATERPEDRHIPAARADLDSPEDLLTLPLLRVLSPAETVKLGLSKPAEAFALAVTSADYERDADGILEQLDAHAGWAKANLLFDLYVLAHARQWSELHRRLDLSNGDASVLAAAEVAPAMMAPENSESFITFDDTFDFDAFFANNTLADWMLFLHPEQKKVAERDFRGPARLRGVSGSGKTCVLVHRARYLAKKYSQPVLLVTLTESMRRLLDHLADELCGVERGRIIAFTMSGLAKRVLQEAHPQSSMPSLSGDRKNHIIVRVAEKIRSHRDVSRTPLDGMDDERLREFLRDELAFVRSRLRSTELDDYADTQRFQRRGRGAPLNELARNVVLDGIRFYEQELAVERALDHEGVVAEAHNALDALASTFNPVRAVLCDEVQDLSQLELALLGRLPTPTGNSVAAAENGLFLAGDGAQTIYRRGFALRRAGIDVVGRSFVLGKNYRNTHEILKAAFGLVAEYEFADVDEDNVVRPSEPDFAKRHGSRPMIVRFSSPIEEAAAVARSVGSLLAMGQTGGQICIIGPSTYMRDHIHQALDDAGIPHADLRHDVDYESASVKVSTIESAKGHEFGEVFIVGLVEGVLPNAALHHDEMPREAARLYVAMTRARDNLTLSYSPWQGYAASRFLLAIQADCDEARYRDGLIVRA